MNLDLQLNHSAIYKHLSGIFHSISIHKHHFLEPSLLAIQHTQEPHPKVPKTTVKINFNLTSKTKTRSKIRERNKYFILNRNWHAAKPIWKQNVKHQKQAILGLTSFINLHTRLSFLLSDLLSSKKKKK